ncbi:MULTISPECIES: PilN domain-containing protein [Halomonadaceae]|uniref:PilN domain-containing protein n=1 Tax=Halomonadaceae TaxID=28256 RepID=UPI00159B3A4B|nr:MULTISPECIES: PilN domain-containing protein [Halomonas]QJQ95073.1 fimbrial assembly protein [Halomonas sp. PA5]
MSIEINLLPWRERARERHNRRFFVALALMVVSGVAAGGTVIAYYQDRLDTQRERNAHIQAQTASLNRDIRAIGEHEAARERMLEQIGVFTRLQVGRPQTVYVFNQLVESLEEGVHYTQLSRQGNTLRLSGLAESNRQVSNQLRSLAAASALDIPVLSEVEAEESGSRRRFSLSVTQHMPAREEAP